MSFVATCVGFVALLSVTSARIIWNPLTTPTGDDRHKITFSRWATVDGRFNREEGVWDGNQLGTQYQTLQRSSNDFGGYKSKSGVSLTAEGDTSSNQPDYSSLLNLNIVEGDSNILYSITHFEADTPASVYLTKIKQDIATGVLTVDSNSIVDFSKYNGVIYPCAGSVTPWMTHLGSEEFPPNARDFDPANVATWKTSPEVLPYLAYMDVDISSPATLDDSTVLANWKPYKYGHDWEATVSPAGAVEVVKMFSMGRHASEMALVMPDRRTVYISVDGAYKPFLMFKAHTAGDLTRGCLSAMRVTQTSDPLVQGGTFTVSWIPMGCGSNTLIEPLTDTVIFSDIFEYVAPTAGACPTGFRKVQADSLECLKLKTGMKFAAVFLETTRMASYMGATNEWNKWEGITLDTKRNRLYATLSRVEVGMLDEKNGFANAIKLPKNSCGCVYAIALNAPGSEKEYVATSITTLVCGVPNPKYTAPVPFPAVPGSADDLDLDKNNKCMLNGIAGPDNVHYVPGHDALLIGEDTSGHQNNVLWYYDFNPINATTPNLNRILTAPFGAEITGNSYFADVNGFAYIMANVQHPYGESDVGRINDTASTGRDGYVGYIGHNTAVAYYADLSETAAGLAKWGDYCPPSTFTYPGCKDTNICTFDECTINFPSILWTCQRTPIENCCRTAADCAGVAAPPCRQANASSPRCQRNKCFFKRIVPASAYEACMAALMPPPSPPPEPVAQTPSPPMPVISPPMNVTSPPMNVTSPPVGP